MIGEELPNGLIDVSLRSPHMAYTFQLDVLHLVPFSFVLVAVLARNNYWKYPVPGAVDDKNRELPGGSNAEQRLQTEWPGMRRHRRHYLRALPPDEVRKVPAVRHADDEEPILIDLVSRGQ